MSYQIIAFDMDGTLLNSSKQISPETLDAIQFAVDHGKQVALSTGRCLSELTDLLPLLPGVRYAICASGAYVYDLWEKRYIYASTLSDETIRKILEISRLEKTMVQLMNADSIVARDDVRNMDQFQMSIYRPMYEKVVVMVDDIYRYYEEQKPQVMKLNIYHTDPERREVTIQRLSSLNIEVVRSEITSSECSGKGVTKGVGLQQLCDHLGIELQDSIAVGDADNDLAMLTTAGLSIAMGNAKEHIKEVCDVVVADNDHGGCVEAIMRYLMK